MIKLAFNEELLRKKINEGKLILQTNDLDIEQRKNVERMINQFSEYLEYPIKEEATKEIDLMSSREMLNNLSFKMNRDLNIFDLKHWKKIASMCSKTKKINFKLYNYNYLPQNDDDMVDIILNFYEKLDNEFYYHALQIMQSPIPLINISDKKNNRDHCFICSYMNVPLINISQVRDFRYVALCHELQHGINWLNYGKNIHPLFSETASIFSETLFTDKLNKSHNCRGLYSKRINDTNLLMKRLIEYIEVLSQFSKKDNSLNLRNVSSILCINTKEELKDEYEYLINTDFVSYYKYILSFMRSLELRDIFYNGGQRLAIRKLKRNLSGTETEVDNRKLVKSYNEHIKDIKFLYSLNKTNNSKR